MHKKLRKVKVPRAHTQELNSVSWILKFSIAKVQQVCKEREYIGRLIDTVKSPLHRRVLQRKYINGDTFEQIAVYENKTFKHIAYVVHPQALEMINFGNDATK